MKHRKWQGLVCSSTCLFLPLAILPQVNEDGEITTVASWYGPGFHGKKTASGERFDQNKLTAASKTLPFGTKLRVKNLKNGKTVTVVINDRGPFVKGRGIDLSKAAAQSLGIDGIAKVSYSTLPQFKPQPPAATELVASSKPANKVATDDTVAVVADANYLEVQEVSGVNDEPQEQPKQLVTYQPEQVSQPLETYQPSQISQPQQTSQLAQQASQPQQTSQLPRAPLPQPASQQLKASQPHIPQQHRLVKDQTQTAAMRQFVDNESHKAMLHSLQWIEQPANRSAIASVHPLAPVKKSVKQAPKLRAHIVQIAQRHTSGRKVSSKIASSNIGKGTRSYKNLKNRKSRNQQYIASKRTQKRIAYDRTPSYIASSSTKGRSKFGRVMHKFTVKASGLYRGLKGILATI